MLERRDRAGDDQGLHPKAEGLLLSLFQQVGSFSKTASVGAVSQSVVGVGFRPRALLVWSAGSFVDSSVTAGFRSMFGVATASDQQFGISSASADAVTTPVSGRAAQATLVSFVDQAGTILVQGSLISFDVDGFTLFWSTNDGLAREIHYLALAGTDLIGARAFPFSSATVTGDSAVSGIGFKPQACILMAADIALPSTAVTAVTHIGMFSQSDLLGNAQCVVEGLSESMGGVANSDTYRIQLTNACLNVLDVSGTTLLRASFSAMNPDGFTLNYSVAPGGSIPIICLALRGVYARVGSFNKATGAAPVIQAVNAGVGCSIVILLGTQNTTSGVSSAHNRIGFGVGCKTTALAASAAHADTDNVATTHVRRFDHRGRIYTKINNATATVDASAELYSLDPSGFSLRWVTNDAVATEILYLTLLGNPSPAGWAREEKGGGTAFQASLLDGENQYGYGRSVFSAGLAVGSDGDEAVWKQTRWITPGALYCLSGAYFTQEWNDTEDIGQTYVWFSVQEKYGYRTVGSDGIAFGNGEGNLILLNTEGRWRRFSFTFIGPSATVPADHPSVAGQVEVNIRLGFSAIGDATFSAAYFDDIKLQPVFDFAVYDPYLGTEALPSLEIAATSLVAGDKTVGIGSLTILNGDGIAERAFSQLLLFNKPVKVVFGGRFLDGQEVMRDDCRTQSLSFIKDHRGDDDSIVLDLEDSRSFLQTVIPLRTTSLLRNPSMDLNRVGASVPYIFGNAVSVPKENTPYVRPTRIDRDPVTLYPIYELADVADCPNGLGGIFQAFSYDSEDGAEKNPGSPVALIKPVGKLTISPLRETISVIDNLRPHNLIGGEASQALENPLPILMDFDTGGVVVNRVVADGAITTGTNSLSSTTVKFVSADIGRFIDVAGAGPAGGLLTTTIADVTSGTVALLAVNASTTVSGASVTLYDTLIRTRRGALSRYASDIASDETALWSSIVAGITWTYSHTTHKFTVAKSSGTFNLRPATGPNKQNSADAWAALGFRSNVDRQGSLTYVGDDPTFTDADAQIIFQVIVNGYVDDALGTFTGVPNSVIGLAPDMVRFLFQQILKHPPERIDVSSFIAARAGEGSHPCWAYLGSPEQFSEVLRRFEQTMLADIVVDGEGIVYCVPYKTTMPVVRAFSDDDFLSFSSGKQFGDIATNVKLMYGYDPHVSRYASVEVGSASSLLDPNTVSGKRAKALIGGDDTTLTVETYLSYNGSANARAVDFLKLAIASPWVISFSTRSKLIDLRIGDRITVSRARGFAFGGTIVSRIFRVRRLTHDYVSGISSCVAIEEVILA